MLRFQTAIASGLAALLVVPAFLGQGQIASLQDALSGTRRALDVLKGLEQRLQSEPAAALGLILAATELPRGEEAQRDRQLEELRSEVSLLQMELDSMQSPVLGAEGAVQSSLGAGMPSGMPSAPRPTNPAGITTGFDDDLRALLSEAPGTRPTVRSEGGTARTPTPKPDGERAADATSAYSADPLRHGITCYRAGRYAEAYELLAPLSDADALYWQARTLERLERLDEAVALMERALAKGGAAGTPAGFEQRRAETDLEFLRWKRDFVKNLPGGKKGAQPR